MKARPPKPPAETKGMMLALAAAHGNGSRDVTEAEVQRVIDAYEEAEMTMTLFDLVFKGELVCRFPEGGELGFLKPSDPAWQQRLLAALADTH